MEPLKIKGTLTCPPFVVSLSNHERRALQIIGLLNLPFDKPVLSEDEGFRANGVCIQHIFKVGRFFSRASWNKGFLHEQH